MHLYSERHYYRVYHQCLKATTTEYTISVRRSVVISLVASTASDSITDRDRWAFTYCQLVTETSSDSLALDLNFCVNTVHAAGSRSQCFFCYYVRISIIAGDKPAVQRQDQHRPLTTGGLKSGTKSAGSKPAVIASYG